LKRKVFERRTEMLRDVCRGVPLKLIVKDLAEKYGVSVKSVYADWEKRNEWMSQIVQLEDKSLVYELVEGLKQIIPAAWIEYEKGDNTAARVGALKVAQKTYRDLIEVLQSIGVIEKKPEQIEASVVIRAWDPDEN